MPLGTATISLDLSDILGADFDARRTKVWVTTNVPSETIVDTDGNKIRLGSGNVTVNADGTGTFTTWVPGAGSNPASWQTYLHVDYPDRNATRGRGQRTFGPFTITTSADLADLIAEQEVPPTYISQVTAQLDAKVTEAQGYAQQAHDLSNIETTDDAVDATLKLAGGKAAATLSASIAQEVPPHAEAAAAAYLASNPAVADAAALAAATAVDDVAGPVSGVVGAMARYNLAPNPGPTIASGWGASSGTTYAVAFDTSTVRRAGTQSSRITRQAVTLNSVLANWNFVGAKDAVVANLAAVTPGQTYCFSVYARPPAAALARLTVVYYNAANTIISTLISTDMPISAGTFENRPYWTTTAPAGAAKRQLQVRFSTANGSSAAGGEQSWICDAQFEVGSTPTPYRDGNMTADGATEADIRWTGTAGQSSTKVTRTVAVEAETRMAPVIAAAVAIPTGAATHQVHKDDIKRGKGGRIGTNGRAVVTFRVDHGLDEFLTNFWPLFKARGIPVSFGAVTRAIGAPADPYEPTDSTWAQLKAANLEGVEVWSHSATHEDPDTDGLSLVEEIVGSKQAIEANGLKCMGWQTPGTGGGVTPDYGSNWNHATSWESEVGQLILGNYGVSENVGNGGGTRALPTDGSYMLDHITLDSRTIASAKGQVDIAVGFGLGIELIFHPRFIIEGSTAFTVADMTALLDYVVTLRDAGTVEVLTATGLAFADPGSARRLDLLRDNGFEGLTNAGNLIGANWALSAAAPAEVILGTDGGKVGSNYLRFPSAAGFTYASQGQTHITNLHLHGFTFIAEAWCRAPAGAAGGRLSVMDAADNTRLNVKVEPSLAAGQGWTKVYLPFSIPADGLTTNLSVRIQRLSGETIDWDEIHVYPV